MADEAVQDKFGQLKDSLLNLGRASLAMHDLTLLSEVFLALEVRMGWLRSPLSSRRLHRF